MFYIKKLQFQELGSPKPDGSVSRGRYMLVSKKNDGFFPPLSTTELNDAILLPIIPPNSDEKVYCTFVYNNDKFHGSSAKQPRDEFRLYLNTKIDPERSFFKPSDIIVFEKIKTDELVNLYKMHRFQKSNENYSRLEDIIENSELRGGHALFSESLDFITKYKIEDLDFLETVIPDEVKREVDKRQSENKDELTNEIENTKGANLFNSVSFRDFVLLGYQYKCAISNQVIAYKKLMNLQAAHIKPKAHSGSFLPCNGIALSQDLHWAFDKGMFTITDDYEVQIHDDIQSEHLRQFENKKINLPIEDFFKPDKTFLKHHRENVFGLFKHSGSIRAL